MFRWGQSSTVNLAMLFNDCQAAQRKRVGGDDIITEPFCLLAVQPPLTCHTVIFFRFVNLRFTVKEGAMLAFDMPVTRFGPNSNVRNLL